MFQLLSSVIESGNESVAVHIPDIILSLVGAIAKYLPPTMEPWPQVCFPIILPSIISIILGSYDLLNGCFTWKAVQQNN